MISPTQIMRHLEAEDFRHLVDRILSNGRCRSTAARSALTQQATVRIAAHGLGLQRMVELTYRPNEFARRIAQRLIAMQQTDGLFGEEQLDTESRLAATATSLRALIMWMDLEGSSGRSVAHAASDAVACALSALAGRFGGGIDVHADAVGWAIVLWQLGDVPAFRRAVRTRDLLAALDEADADVVEHELSRFAHAMAA